MATKRKISKTVAVPQVPPETVSPDLISALNKKGINDIKSVDLVVHYEVEDDGDDEEENALDLKLKNVRRVEPNKKDKKDVELKVAKSDSMKTDQAYQAALALFRKRNDLTKLDGQVWFDETGKILTSYVKGSFCTWIGEKTTLTLCNEHLFTRVARDVNLRHMLKDVAVKAADETDYGYCVDFLRDTGCDGVVLDDAAIERLELKKIGELHTNGISRTALSPVTIHHLRKEIECSQVFKFSELFPDLVDQFCIVGNVVLSQFVSLDNPTDSTLTLARITPRRQRPFEKCKVQMLFTTQELLWDGQNVNSKSSIK